ncbi:MAG: hypothetical protein LH628_06975 [Microcoleus sp. CAN_BIN18]|nr:hypothetical protein [Microcoleus sp. CAN_BIN18]
MSSLPSHGVRAIRADSLRPKEFISSLDRQTCFSCCGCDRALVVRV